LLAVLLGPQIDVVERQLAQREALARRYENALADSPFAFPAVEEGVVSARHLFPIGVPGGQRDHVLRALGERGIGATVNYRSVTTLTLYRDPDAAPKVPVSTAWGEQTLSLPLFPDLRPEEQDEVLQVLLNEIAPAFLADDRNYRKAVAA
jgi:UDP-4-amino-4-deoxy-L-arabinose-oxoglutarate aminotransferase